jgi:hypothetical protein
MKERLRSIMPRTPTRLGRSSSPQGNSAWANEYLRHLEPVIQSRRLVVNAFQLTRITRDKGALAKDDRLDALAMAVAYWSKALSSDTAKVVQQNRDKLMQ